MARTVGANRERTRPRGAEETRDARGVTRGIARVDIVAEVEGADAEVSLAFADHRRPRRRARPSFLTRRLRCRKFVAFGVRASCSAD